jgi:integrase
MEGLIMAKEVKKLTALEIKNARVGDHGDGDGLFLRVSRSGASWVLRYTAPNGRRREMGLGAADRSTDKSCGESVVRARGARDDALYLVRKGIDPIDQRDAARAQAKAEQQAKVEAEKTAGQLDRNTLCRVARKYHAEEIEPQRSTKHAAQWIASLELNIPVDLWHAPISSIKAPALFQALAQLQLKIPVTASRIRQRLEAIFDDAMFNELCAANPAASIKARLAKRPKGREKGEYAARPYDRVPAFAAALRQQPGTAARALEFALLCASRTGEVLGATWDEIDERSGTWTIPAARMKGKKEHAVFLSSRALEILKKARELQSVFVFPSPVDIRRPMSNMAMLAVLRRMGLAKKTTVHGVCRASFSTWANELGIARSDVIEACLAHSSKKDPVRAAYNRASYNAERRDLLKAWADYCSGEQVQAEPTVSANVVPFAEPARARAAA